MFFPRQEYLFSLHLSLQMIFVFFQDYLRCLLFKKKSYQKLKNFKSYVTHSQYLVIAIVSYLIQVVSGLI